MFTKHFYIEGKYYGQVSVPFQKFNQELFTPTSTIFFCYKCGKVFAQCPVLDVKGKSTEWRALQAICPDCPPTHSFELPGSIWLIWNSIFNSYLSKEVLTRELLLLIDYMEKKHD